MLTIQKGQGKDLRYYCYINISCIWVQIFQQKVKDKIVIVDHAFALSVTQ